LWLDHRLSRHLTRFDETEALRDHDRGVIDNDSRDVGAPELLVRLPPGIGAASRTG